MIYEFQHEWGTEDWISRGTRFNLGAGRGNAPVAADIYHMLSGAEMGCAVLDLGFASAPAGQTPPRLTFTGGSPAIDRLQLSSINYPTYDLRVLAFSTRGLYVPLQGFTLVPFPDLWWPAQSAGMPMDIPLPVGLANGLVLYFQEFFTVGPEIYSSNALCLEIIH